MSLPELGISNPLQDPLQSWGTWFLIRWFFTCINSFHFIISGADENVLRELENVDNDIENDQHDNVRFRDGNKVPDESSENEDEDENEDPNDMNEGVEEDEIEEEDNDDRDMTPEEEEEMRSELEESEEDMMKKSFGSVRIQNVTIPEYSQACSECELISVRSRLFGIQ